MSARRARSLASACVLGWILLCGAQAHAARKPFVDYWMGIYSGNMQIGTMHTTITSDRLDGTEVLRKDQRLCVKLREGDTNASQADLSRSTTAGSRLTPIRDQVEIHTNWRTKEESQSEHHDVTIDMRYDQGTPHMTMVVDGKTTERTIDDPGEEYVADFGGRRLAVGDSVDMTLPDLDPSPSGRISIQFSDKDRQVIRREKIQIGTASYDSFVLTSKDSKSTAWTAADGALLKAECAEAGLRLERQNEADAFRWLSSKGPDTMSVQVDKQIADSTNVTDLHIRLLGIQEKGLVISDDRQHATYDPAKRSAEYTIAATPFDLKNSSAIPVHGKQFKRWLGASAGIEVGDKDVQALAKQIVGNETDAYKAACKIRDWVYANMKYDLDAGTASSAVAALKARKGVCTNYAILYTALARAAGIPTKMVVGLVYGTWDGPGEFQFHTWAESYVGQWVAFEPTWGDDVVDATHIKMLEGGVETVSDYYRATGRMTAEVISATSPAQHVQQGVGHIIYIANDADVMQRSKGGSLSWWSARKAGNAKPVSIPDGSLVIAQGGSDHELIIPSLSKIDSPDIPKYEWCRQYYGDHIVIVMEDGEIVILSEGSKIISGLGKN